MSFYNKSHIKLERWILILKKQVEPRHFYPFIHNCNPRKIKKSIYSIFCHSFLLNELIIIPYFRNFKFVSVCSLVGRYFCRNSTICIYIIVKQFEIVFFFNVKDKTIFPCLHNIRLSFNIYKCCSALSIRVCMSTYNSKPGSFLC